MEFSKDLAELVPSREISHPSLKTEKELERLQHEIECCENLIKKQEIRINEFQTIIKLKNADLSELKAKLQTNPGYHAIEYIEEKLEKS